MLERLNKKNRCNILTTLIHHYKSVTNKYNQLRQSLEELSENTGFLDE